MVVLEMIIITVIAEETYQRMELTPSMAVEGMTQSGQIMPTEKRETTSFMHQTSEEPISMVELVMIV